MRFASLFLFLLGLAVPTLQAEPQEKEQPKAQPKAQNRLAKERSPYLLMHAHNPVDWYPWGQEAFDKAAKENKLVFLSVGYSSCYWCHVMERESFNSPVVAKLLNDNFVCIKVDREERPDIDQIYMAALTTINGGRGGWPMSMFLTEEGKPFFGGTYWPREDRMDDGVPVRGFKTILAAVAQSWQENSKNIYERAERFAKLTSDSLQTPGAVEEVLRIDRRIVNDLLSIMGDTFDDKHGGFSLTPAAAGPKFPLPSRVEFLLRQSERTKSADALKMARLQLDQMAQGGIYDHIGGGFHRYSTERTWTVPHFEKMLYDNAQLVSVYARAYRLTKDPSYARVLRETLAYIAREMTSPEGGFYSSQDAETNEEEGRFYVWSNKELDEVLTDKDANKLFRAVYLTSRKPNFEGEFFIPRLAQPLAETAKEMKLTEAELDAKLAPLRKQLLEARSKRPRPLLNKVMLTAWSGLMIAGYTEASQALGDKAYLDIAIKAADFVLKNQKTPEGRLLRTFGAPPGGKATAAVPAYLEDYAFLVHGLLALHDATKDARWLKEARGLTDAMIKHHGDPKKGGYYFTSNDHEKLFARAKDQIDGAQPAGNSLAIRNLIRLWELTGEARYREESEKNFREFAGALRRFPLGLTAMITALDIYLDAQPPKKD